MRSRLRRTPWFAWLLLVSTALCALVAGSVTLGGQLLTANAQDGLAAARDRWAAQPVDHYQLEVTLDDNWVGSCRQTVEVRAEAVVAVMANTCQDAPFTIALLFERLARDIDQLEGSCGPNGCWCDGVWRVRADYDTQRGHPTRIKVAVNATERYFYFWEIVQGRRGCTLIGWTTHEMRATLTPLP